MIEVKDIVKTYGATVAVNHVSFHVGKGEILGFLGPNGAGKSTTLKILTCFVVADSGTVRVNGCDVLEDSLGVRQSIGYLPESTPLYYDMRVMDYLRFAAKARQIPTARISAAIDRVVAQVKIERMLKKNVGHLSKGYKQRVGLAQAMIHDPPILILDEPTSGLDPHQIIEIRELLRTLGKTKLVLFSSHILQEISAICTRIVIIKDGRLVADGTPEHLQTKTSGQQVVRARISGPESAVQERLRGIGGIDSIEVIRTVGDSNDFRVRGKLDSELGRAVHRVVSEAGWSLSILEPETRTLEDVYLQLTQTRPAGSPQAMSA